MRSTMSPARSKRSSSPRDGDAFDVIHDHCGFTALAMADRIATPIVHTLHGQFTPSTAAFYLRHADKAALVGISRAQLASAPPGLGRDSCDPQPARRRCLAAGRAQGRHMLWIGRMTPEKGPHRAIAAARAASVPLVLAGVIQPGHARILRARGGTPDRRHSRPLRRRGRRRGQTLAVRARARAADADPLG